MFYRSRKFWRTLLMSFSLSIKTLIMWRGLMSACLTQQQTKLQCYTVKYTTSQQQTSRQHCVVRQKHQYLYYYRFYQENTFYNQLRCLSFQFYIVSNYLISVLFNFTEHQMAYIVLRNYSHSHSCSCILAHRTQKPTCQNTQLFTWHLPLCSKSWLYLWRTSYILWPNYISLKSLLLSRSSICCIRPYLDSSTACTTATSIVHSKLDYCNSVYYKLYNRKGL